MFISLFPRFVFSLYSFPSFIIRVFLKTFFFSLREKTSCFRSAVIARNHCVIDNIVSVFSLKILLLYIPLRYAVTAGNRMQGTFLGLGSAPSPGLSLCCSQVVLIAADPLSHSCLPRKDTRDSEYFVFTFMLEYSFFSSKTHF